MKKEHKRHNRIIKLFTVILSAALFCAGMAGCGESGAEVKVTEDLESMRYVELDEKVGEEINSMLSDQGKEFFEMFLAKAGEFEYEIIDTDKGGGDESEETVTVRIRTYPFASEYLRTWTDYLESSEDDEYDDAKLYEGLFRNLSSLNQKDYLTDVTINCYSDEEGSWVTDARSNPDLLDAILGGMLNEIVGLAGVAE